MLTVPITVPTPPSISSAALGVELAKSAVLIEEMRKLAEIFLDMFLRLAPERRLLYETATTLVCAPGVLIVGTRDGTGTRILLRGSSHGSRARRSR